jgi:hypothetical protein
VRSNLWSLGARIQDAGQVTERLGRLRNLLRNAGYDDVSVGIRGSSVVGTSNRTGASFGSGSDIDFFITSASLERKFASQITNASRYLDPDVLRREAPELFRILEAFGLESTTQIGRTASVRLVESSALAPGSYVTLP